MSDRIEEFQRKAAEGKRVSLNLPAMARRDEEFMTCWQADPVFLRFTGRGIPRAVCNRPLHPG